MSDEPFATLQGEVLCSFCGKPREEGQKMISAARASICESCARLAVRIIDKTRALETDGDASRADT